MLYYDPQASTLLELLRNISEEVEEYDPGGGGNNNDTTTGGGVATNVSPLMPSADTAGTSSSSTSSAIATLSNHLRELSSRQSSPQPFARGPMGNVLPANGKVKSLEPTAASGVVPIVSAEPSPLLSRRTSHDERSKSNMTVHIPSIQISRAESQLALLDSEKCPPLVDGMLTSYLYRITCLTIDSATIRISSERSGKSYHQT